MWWLVWNKSTENKSIFTSVLHWSRKNDAGGIGHERCNDADAFDCLLAILMASSKRRLPDSRLPFDGFFSAYYGATQWSTIRQALQAPKQSCALINRYSTFDETLFPSDQFHRLESVCTPTMTVLEPIDSTSVHDVPRPINHSHYPMCASSLLPILALDIQGNDHILDLCASPGGKSLAILQQFDASNHLTSNEMSRERFQRLTQTLKSHLPSAIVQKQVRLTNIDGTRQQAWTKTFDKVLIDAPCSGERHLVHSSSTHLWSVKRSKANARRQIELLRAALRCVKSTSGTIVYSTCSLSPFENDLVIEQFLQLANGRVQVHRQTFPFGSATEYGWMVLPKPWGPFYLCVLHVRDPAQSNIDAPSAWRFRHDATSSSEEEEQEEEEKEKEGAWNLCFSQSEHNKRKEEETSRPGSMATVASLRHPTEKWISSRKPFDYRAWVTSDKLTNGTPVA